MTAEIAIMNKNAVALAADSAVTIKSNRRVKVYSTNKLFALSQHSPVGIMVHGDAEIMGVPWEVVIKAYRKQQRDAHYSTLDEYGDSFINYLKHNTGFFSEADQDEHIDGIISYNLNYIKDKIDSQVRALTVRQKGVAVSEMEQIVTEAIENRNRELLGRDTLAAFPDGFAEATAKKYHELMSRITQDVFQDRPLTPATQQTLQGFCVQLLVRDWFQPYCSGIVIAGFGEQDTFPALISYHIDGLVNGELKHQTTHKKKITKNNPVEILPFAQSDMVTTFLEGFNPQYQATMQSYFRQLFEDYHNFLVDKLPLDALSKEDTKEKLGLLGRDLVNDAFTKIQKSWEDRYIKPILNAVEVLPREELAAMAEYLIELTSLKRKVTFELETVAGPVDVAVISKSDGFIWMKRKHGFDISLNPHFRDDY